MSVLLLGLMMSLMLLLSFPTTAMAGSRGSSGNSVSMHIITSLLAAQSSDSSSAPKKTAVLADRILNIERTFVAIKPDGIQRHLIGEIIQRIERKGLRLVGIKVLSAPTEMIEEHYAEHRTKEYFADLVSFFSSGPILAMVWEGHCAIGLLRKVIGATHPEDALPGTIRGDFSYERGRNLIHSSDSVLNAKREISIWFQNHELLSTSSF